jgi:cytoplasmic tRNA 2-thiolation protein 1
MRWLNWWVSFKALDRGAALLKVDKLATGHNADDIAETVLLNILRGDIARWMHFQLLSVVYSKGLCSKLIGALPCRLSRCTSIITGEDGPIPRCKPFKYTYEKEIVIYPYFEILNGRDSLLMCCHLLNLLVLLLKP